MLARDAEDKAFVQGMGDIKDRRIQRVHEASRRNIHKAHVEFAIDHGKVLGM